MLHAGPNVSRVARMTFPFSAIVGQRDMKRALVACVVDPSLHGVLVRGQRGTAKSTAARALVELLPEQQVVVGCASGCDPDDVRALCQECRGRLDAGQALARTARRMPLVDLPVGATEDRVLGTVDIERALRDGVQAFRPGLLAQVNRGILYIDEVNLLSDHLMDVLLDAAAMGTNVVEREGVSHTHPSRFILVGTMNPEEGNLRPQLTDRFDLGVEVRGTSDPGERRQVLEARLAYEADPQRFCSEWRDEEQALAARIALASARLGQVEVPGEALDAACQLAVELALDGHRAEIALIKAGRALAALDGAPAVTGKELAEAARMAVTHRLTRLDLSDGAGEPAELAAAIERMARTDRATRAAPRGEAQKKTPG